jgi:two-component system, NarL family, response regulator DegU
MRIRVVLADDHRLVREGLQRTLTDAGLDVVGEARDGDEAQQLAVRLRPDIVLMDVSMPGADGITVARRLRSRAPETRVVVLTMHDDADLLERAWAAGVVGYLVKDASGADVVDAVRRVHQGARVISPGLGEPPASATDTGDEALPAAGWARVAAVGSGTAPEVGEGTTPPLSDRERQVLQLLADGGRPADVADRLVISPKTVRNHLANIYAKLDVHDRSQAIVVGLRQGLIELSDR